MRRRVLLRQTGRVADRGREAIGQLEAVDRVRDDEAIGSSMEIEAQAPVTRGIPVNECTRPMVEIPMQWMRCDGYRGHDHGTCHPRRPA